MKKQIGILAAMALFAAAFISCASPSAAGERIELHAVARLSDGSELKGMAQERTLDAESGNVGAFKLDLAKVAEIRPGRQAPSTIVFADGDTLHATLSPKHEKFTLESLLGRIDIPFADIRTLTFSKRVLGDEEDLLYYCTFDDAASIESPQAGPAGKFLAGEFVPGKVGKALLVKARTLAAEIPFPIGLMQPQGCIEFWGKIPEATKESRFPDGGNPTFFAMRVGRWVNTFVKYTANDGFGTGGLHADLPGSAYVSSLPSYGSSAAYPDFIGDPSAWHHYALVWSKDGLDAESKALGRSVVSALYVDGRLVNPAYGQNGPDRGKLLEEFVVNPIVLGFPSPCERQGDAGNRVDFLMDEFKIWSKPKTEFTIIQ